MKKTVVFAIIVLLLSLGGALILSSSGDDHPRVQRPNRPIITERGNDAGLQAATRYYLPPRFYFTGSAPQSVAVGDVNGDGKNEVVVANGTLPDAANDNKLILFTYDISTGKLNAPSKHDLANPVYEIDLGDINSDGKADVVASRADGIDVYPGGALSSHATYTTTHTVQSNALAAGDVTGDGKDDVVVCTIDGGGQYYVEVLAQSGGVLTAGVPYAIPARAEVIEIGDVGGGGDVVVMMPTNANQVGVLTQNAGGTLDAVVEYAMTGATTPYGLKIGDITGGGNDVVVSNYSSVTNNNWFGIFEQNSGGTLQPVVKYPTGVGYTEAIGIADANLDGKLDILCVVNISGPAFALYEQEAGGGFPSPGIIYAIPYPNDRKSLEMGDVDGDGAKDVVLVNYNSRLSVNQSWDGSSALVLKLPNGGQTWSIDATKDIYWGNYGDTEYVDIYYSTDGGVTWKEIIKRLLNVNPKKYAWKIPPDPSTDCRIKIVDSEDSSLEDTSAYSFTIADDGVDRLQLTSPNGGETIEENTVHNITWLKTGSITNVDIQYTSDNGTTWIDIVNATSNDGSYTWTVPIGAASDQCLVRIFDSTDNDPQDDSDTTFRIVPEGTDTITVTSPNGGESLAQGSAYTISWSTTGSVGNVKIEYSINNGSNWGSIVDSTANTGSYGWTVPGYESQECLIRITQVSGGDPSDTSDAVFAIVKGSSTVPGPGPGPSPGGKGLPIARIYVPAYHVYLGTRVRISAEPSYDRDGSVVAYEWKMISKPAGSGAGLSTTTGMKTAFTANKTGSYRMRLRVKDDKGNWSRPFYFTIQASRGIPPQLNLVVERKKAGSLMIQRSYAVVHAKIEPSPEVPATIVAYRLYRKEDGANWEMVEDFISKLEPDKWGLSFSYEYVDKYLDNDKGYSYKIEAVDDRGQVVATASRSI